MQIINNNLRLLIIVFLCATVIFGARLTYAQFTNPTGLLVGQIQIITTPDQPAANTEVSLQAKSYSADLNAMDITWYANDKMITSGYGKRTATVTLGGVGSSTRIRVVGKMAGVVVIEGTTTIRPSEIHIILEADTTAPFWYMGRKLPAPRGVVRITAFPTLTGTYQNSSPKRLLYTWKVDGSDAVALSGIGASTYVFRLPKSPAETVRVQVSISDPRGTYSAQSSINVGSEKSRITVYSNQSHSIARKSVISSLSMRAGEKIGLIAIPYNVSTESVLEYSWDSSGKAIPNTGGAGNTIQLSMPTTPTFYNITASFLNTHNVFERASSQLKLIVE